MKFCKNLKRIIELSNQSNPEWAPFWVNYKALKKLILQLQSLVPAEEQDQSIGGPDAADHSLSTIPIGHQQHGDDPVEFKNPKKRATHESEDTPAVTGTKRRKVSPAVALQIHEMRNRPGEIAFFKLLHSELRKSIRFFENAQRELLIRDARVREGVAIAKQRESITLSNRWSKLAQSILKLNMDLILLETYAIMSFCSFSKILKKHDKVTGYDTRSAFVENVVKKANFVDYPEVFAMIKGCEERFKLVMDILASEGKMDCLCEDERLFIDMVRTLNVQAMGTAKGEGVLVFSGRQSRNGIDSVASLMASRPSQGHFTGDSTSPMASRPSHYCFASSPRSTIEQLYSIVEPYRLYGDRMMDSPADGDVKPAAKLPLEHYM